MKTNNPKESQECGSSCCSVQAIVSVDERGQMVLPKEIREKAGIQANEKLAVILCEKDGAVCCITLVRAEEMMGMVRNLLGPVMKELASDPPS